MSFNELAPVYNLDAPSYLSIEYPLRVKNVDKAIGMVGGGRTIAQCFIEPEKRLELKLRPGDVYSHPVNSEVCDTTENVLLKLRIPKKVLEKHNRNVQLALQECEQNKIAYESNVEAVLNKTYKFRQLADFQTIHKKSQFTNKFLESVGKADLDKIKQFADYIEEDYKNQSKFENCDLDVPPLIRYARVDIPYNYKYVGNLLIDENGELTRDTVKLHTIFVDWGEKPPSSYDPALQKELEKCENEVQSLKERGLERIVPDSPAYSLLRCIEILEKLFTMKPIWLRRHIGWMLPARLRPQLRFALPYVAYTTKKGPWRQSYIKLGYDPTTDPKAVAFQVEAFRMSVKSLKNNEIEKMVENGEETLIVPQTLAEYKHEFTDQDSVVNQLGIGKVPRQMFYDGVNATCAVSFQIGDMMDEDVKRILRGAQIQEQCFEATGWLDWVTVCRIRGVIKYKLDCIDKGRKVDAEKVDAIMAKSSFPFNDYKGLVPREEEDNEDETEQTMDQNTEIAKDDLITRLQVFNSNNSEVLEELDGLLKQELFLDAGGTKP
ncbi:hypothetical protein OGAPHI_000684 [Ogataea philodendri]|uniref:Uncharacterized protein n=1 Tax=Ogataea philodendri TaxID=1378263 RepID=A0A9P8PEV7_9ASCO|nr:uncharacterized protein OGAPHI_000684 [Ogataea philodendri]KAH3670973.1 hypothetical protein OGAPHI_000684 [Ogataea philodendri]